MRTTVKVDIKDKIEFDLPDAWGGHVSIIASSRAGAAPGWSAHFTSEPLRTPMNAAEYAAAQGSILAANLASYSVAREFEFTESDRNIPVREYTWKPDDHVVHQCQAYFIIDGDAWTLTFSAGAEDYEKLRGAIPDLLRGIRPSGTKVLQ
jgi:hypothetical protein